DTATGPPAVARPGDGADDACEGDVAKSRIEDEMRRREEALPAYDHMTPDVPIQSEGLEEQAGERKREDGPSGHARQGTEEAQDVHRSALAGPRPSSGGYFKPRDSSGSGLRSNPVDGHEQFGFPAQPGRGVRRLEKLLPNIDGTGQGRRDPEREGPRIHLPPGVVHDRMSSRLEGFDDSREQAGDRV